MSYLHELAETYRNTDRITDRRRDDWAQIRADIDLLIKSPGRNYAAQAFIVAAYHAGYKRGGELASPRNGETVMAENWNDKKEANAE